MHSLKKKKKSCLGFEFENITIFAVVAAAAASILFIIYNPQGNIKAIQIRNADLRAEQHTYSASTNCLCAS